MKRFSLLLLAALSTAPTVHAQDYPTRQITLISPWPAGGSIDALCRGIAPRLAEILGKPVMVENRPGAGSVTGTAAGAKAAPDGYTLVMGGSGSLAISPTLYKKLPYDPSKDFAPLLLAARSPFFLVVHPSLPVHSVADLVRYAKDNPGKLSFASGGAGGPHQLFAELLKSLTGIEMSHIPYKGNAPAMNDVLAGHVPMMFSDPVATLSLIRAGKVRALGVTTAVRAPVAPEIPPLAESGIPEFDLAGWGLIAAPAGTPKPIVSRLNAELNKVIAVPEVRQQIIALGSIPGDAASPEELQRFVDAEMERWGKIVRLAGLAGTE
jgi:tripartite-type tricarboxylate transporter receptor subunit TctC